MTQYIVNLGYALGLAALAVKDVLWLRCILVLSQVSLSTYAILTGNLNVAFWNLLFLVINSVRIIHLMRERRPIPLPEELADLYHQVFSSMSTKEFLYFWNTGQISKTQNERLVKQGETLEKLSLILSGEVDIIINKKTVAQLQPNSFFAEMSFLTGDPASADVVAHGEIEYISWEQEKLHQLKLLNPTLLIKIQNILGKDLAGKVKASSRD